MSIPVLGPILNVVTEGMSFWRDTKRAKHSMKMAGIENRTRLLLSEQEANHEWEMKALETSSKTLKHLSFFFFAGPILITVVNPTYGSTIWVNLQAVPEGFMQIYYAITGSIWGVAALKDHGVSLKGLLGNKK
jgi:hypothetical protein